MSGTSRTLRLLLIEDNPRDAVLCKAYLERAGYHLRTDTVTCAEEFVAALHSGPYDVVLADYRLPGWSGMDALEMLRRESLDTPFILVTGTVGEETAVECIKKGANDYILKDRLVRLPVAVQRALDDTSAREDRRKADKTRDLLASIVESSDDAIIGLALDGTILTWNRGARRIYGYTAEHIAGKPIAALFAPDSLDTLSQAMQIVRQGRSVDRYETRGSTADGRSIEVAFSMSPILKEDRDLEGISAIIRDITDLKTLEKELLLAQKMEAIGRLAAGVAHDFNNLLTVINGYSTLLLSRLSESDSMSAPLAQINRAGERAASLTRQLLAFSRKQILQPRVLDLNGIVADMNRMLQRLIGEDIDLVTVLDPNLGRIKADPGQIEQVVMNLVVNARDAMPKGGKLTIETANLELQETVTRRHFSVSPGSYVTLTITDSGIGMNQETQARIFEPFFTTKSQGEGTGLGLSTAYGIVSQSGGAIIVYSELGHGTSFKIYLPRDHEAPQRTKAPKAITDSRGSETILVVEDEAAVQALVCTVLEGQGYTVLRAGNGAEALQVCERHAGAIHLTISDVIMPELSGGDLAASLMALQPAMKILFMSGYTDTAIVHHGVLKPGTAFLEKPFGPETLARKVRQVLDAK